MKRLACTLTGHRSVTTETRHPVGRDIIASRSDCRRCGRAISSWPASVDELARDLARVSSCQEQRLLQMSDLHPRAWSLLRERQERLPVGRVRSRRDLNSLRIIEGRAASRVARRLRLADVQSLSVAVHHREAVERILTGGAAGLCRSSGCHFLGRRSAVRPVPRHAPGRRILNFSGWLGYLVRESPGWNPVESVPASNPRRLRPDFSSVARARPHFLRISGGPYTRMCGKVSLRRKGVRLCLRRFRHLSP